MKTKFVLLALICLISTATFSQKVKIGFKGGASINKLSGKSFKEEFSFGYHVGVFATLGMGGKLSLQPEVLLNQVNQDTATSFSSVYHFKSNVSAFVRLIVKNSQGFDFVFMGFEIVAKIFYDGGGFVPRSCIPFGFGDGVNIMAVNNLLVFLSHFFDKIVEFSVKSRRCGIH